MKLTKNARSHESASRTEINTSLQRGWFRCYSLISAIL